MHRFLDKDTATATATATAAAAAVVVLHYFCEELKFRFYVKFVKHNPKVRIVHK
jgi:hypothetical protein